MNEYEYLFNQISNSASQCNFKEMFHIDEDTKTYATKLHTKIEYKRLYGYGLITDYNIKVYDFHSNEHKFTLNYQSDAVTYVPSTEFFEPTWKEFTEDQLKRAIKYLSDNFHMRWDTEPEKYSMLIFENRFHLAIRTKKRHSKNEHNLCITAFNVDLSKIKL